MRRQLALAALPVALAAASPVAAASPAPTLRALVGQRIVARMPGSTPSADFLARIRAGEIGGVILFSNNAPPPGGEAPQIEHNRGRRDGPSALLHLGAHGFAALVRGLQDAARAGKRPPLLIAIDQEGGSIKRLPGPPTLSPRQMTTAAIAKSQGEATARYLAPFGINTNLAPVLDVPAVPGAFIASRTFASTPAAVASRGVAFLQGLEAGGIAATAKHFPGLGGARTDTDFGPSVVLTPKRTLLADLLPFRRAVESHTSLVMISTATYPTLGSHVPAACSSVIVGGLLRKQLGYRGVVISDDLATRGVTATLPLAEAATRAASAGVDLLYAAGPTGGRADASSKAVFDALLRAAERGALPKAALTASYGRIMQLKSGFHY